MFSSECHQLTQGLYRTKEHWALLWESQPRCAGITGMFFHNAMFLKLPGEVRASCTLCRPRRPRAWCLTGGCDLSLGGMALLCIIKHTLCPLWSPYGGVIS